MGMPNDLVLIRHGQSEGNVATEAAKSGDTGWYTDQFTTTPGHQWRLTTKGREQARAAGLWVQQHIAERFDRYYVSPYVRTRETAAHLDLPGAGWSLNRALRERDWGDIGSLPKDEFESRPEYKLNAWLKANDPLYWVAPNGESIAHVAEDRVRNVLSTLHRETTGQRVVCVTHGECMWAFRLVLERLNDEEFAQMDADKSEKIHNCEVLHYTRLDPQSGAQAPRLSWLRRAHPVRVGDQWVMEESPWREVEFRTYTNADLLTQVDSVPSLFPGLPH